MQFSEEVILAGVAENGQEKHRSHPHEDEKSGKDDCSLEQHSLEAVPLPAGDRHNEPSCLPLA